MRKRKYAGEKVSFSPAVFYFNNCSYSLTQRNKLRAFGVPVFDVTSLSFNKEVTKKVNPDVPSGASLFVPLCKEKEEKDIKVFCAFLAGRHHERQIWKARNLAGFLRALGPAQKFLFYGKNFAEQNSL